VKPQERLRRVALLIPFRGVESPAARQLLISLVKFSQELGIDVICDPCRDIKSPFEARYLSKKIFLVFRKLGSIGRLFLASLKYDCLVIPYTTSFFNPLNAFEAKILARLLAELLSRTLSILYVYDSPVLQKIIIENRVLTHAVEAEKLVLRSARIVMAFNTYLKEFLQRVYGLSSDRVIVFEILDNYVNFAPPTFRTLKKNRTIEIVWVGNLFNLKGIPSSLKQARCIRISVYGYGRVASPLGRSVEYKGLILDEERLAREISAADFGLVYHGLGVSRYLTFGTSMKFSTYIVSGLPVITTYDHAYPALVAKRLGVGWVLSSLDQLSELLEEISEDRYERARRNVINLSRKIKRGYFFKRALAESLRRLCRST